MKIVKLLVQKVIPLVDDKLKITKKGATLLIGHTHEAAIIFNYLSHLGEDAKLIIEKDDGSTEMICDVKLESINPGTNPSHSLVRFSKK